MGHQGISLSHVGVPLLDTLLNNQGVSLLFTAVAIGGIANAINMIDGLKGLSTFMMVFALVTIAMIAHTVGDISLAVASLTIAAAIFGFFLLNWPGGIYFLVMAAHTMVVLRLLGAEGRNPSILPFAGLLVCIYLCSEVFVSVYRRKIRAHKPTGPDLQHLHSLIYIRYLAMTKLQVSENSIAGLTVGILSIPTCLCAFYFQESTCGCFISVTFFVLSYLTLYFRVIKFRRL